MWLLYEKVSVYVVDKTPPMTAWTPDYNKTIHA